MISKITKDIVGIFENLNPVIWRIQLSISLEIERGIIPKRLVQKGKPIMETDYALACSLAIFPNAVAARLR